MCCTGLANEEGRTIDNNNSEITAQRQTTGDADAGSSSVNTLNTDANTSISKRMKLIQKHTQANIAIRTHESKLRAEIKSYLQYVVLDEQDENPLVFWQKGIFPSLEGLAKKYLTQSAPSVPVENMFSSMGLILNGKRSTLAPHRANWLSFIHDNYALYFKVAGTQ